MRAPRPGRDFYIGVAVAMPIAAAWWWLLWRYVARPLWAWLLS